MNVLILAGGRSVRFGRDKRLVDVEGDALVDRTLRIAASLGLPLFVAVARGDGALPSRPGVAFLNDRKPGQGPLAALADALEVLGTELLTLAADLPGLVPCLLSTLLQEAVARPAAAAVVPRGPRGLEPLCAIYRPRALRGLRAAMTAGRLGLQEALAGLEGVASVDLEAPVELTNLNTASSLEEARLVAGRHDAAAALSTRSGAGVARRAARGHR